MHHIWTLGTLLINTKLTTLRIVLLKVGYSTPAPFMWGPSKYFTLRNFKVLICLRRSVKAFRAGAVVFTAVVYICYLEITFLNICIDIHGRPTNHFRDTSFRDRVVP